MSNYPADLTDNDPEFDSPSVEGHDDSNQSPTYWCRNNEYGCDNKVVEEGDTCDRCTADEREVAAYWLAQYRRAGPLPKLLPTLTTPTVTHASQGSGWD